MPEGRTLALPGTDGGVAALGTVRRCRQGHKVGPLYAPGPAAAERLLRGLAAAAGPGEELFLDVPAPNAAAMALAGRLGLAVHSRPPACTADRLRPCRSTGSSGSPASSSADGPRGQPRQRVQVWPRQKNSTQPSTSSVSAPSSRIFDL